jgi:predicted metalloprotease with PDZ domain
LLLSALFSCLLLAYQTPEVSVNISVTQPTHHFAQVEMAFPAADSGSRAFQMAVWTPGSYKVRDYAKNVENFYASNGKGEALSWKKIDKTTWLVDANPGEPVVLGYSLFCYEHTVRTNYIDSFYGFLNGAPTVLREKGTPNVAYRLSIEVPEGWRVATALPRLQTNTFLADNYETLVDTPIALGPLRIREFEVAGIPHYWVIAGDVVMNESEMTQALQKLGEVTGALFDNQFPFDRYFFLSFFKPGARGGLEHENSTLVMADSTKMNTKDGWDYFLALMFHEYYHAWNVKAVRDAILWDPDLQQEVYTDLLWFHEGWTSYYDLALMVRAGFWGTKDYKKALVKDIQAYMMSSAAEVQSLAESSFNAWIHLYQPTRTRPNSQVNYYRDGSLAALGLDLVIRHRTKNEHSLDTVVKLLYERFGKSAQGIDYGHIRAVIEELAGTAAAKWTDTHVYQRERVPLDTVLGYAGVVLNREGKEKPEEQGPFRISDKVWLGVRTKEDGQVVTVDHVYRGENGWQAGLDFDDELIAINERRLNSENMKRILARHHVGDEVMVTVSRHGRLLEIPVKLTRDPGSWTLELKEDPNELEQAIFKAIFQPPEVKEPAEAEAPSAAQ